MSPNASRPLVLVLFAAGCSRPPDPVASAASSASASASVAAPVASSPGSASAAGGGAPAATPTVGFDASAATTSTACAAPAPLACRRFAKTEDAFTAILAESPLVLAIGEAHAQKGTEGIASATKRFTDSFVPLLGDRASDLLLEAWAGDPRCQKEVKTVASAQAPVKQAQAESNPNEYVAMGTRAKGLGIQPHLLRPSCPDYAGLADAGADVIPASLALIKRLTQADATTLVRRNLDAKNGKLVVTYGGAMHNDVVPSEKLKDYSFGPALLEETKGRYVELDLIVPEYVKKNEVWEKLPWFAAWQADTGPKDRTTVYRLGKNSFVLIFPSATK